MENVQRSQAPVKENAREYWQWLEKLPELERFCELACAEMRGQLIPSRWLLFMEWYELTAKYRQHREYIEQCRMAEIDRCLREGLPIWSD